MNQTVATFNEVWNAGGPLMYVLAAVSVFALAVFFWALFIQRKNAVAPRALASDLLNAVERGDLTEAKRLSLRGFSVFASIARSTFDLLRDSGNCSTSAIRRHIETAGSHAAGRIQRTAEIMHDTGNVAPLIGLLGTVLGMYSAFRGAADIGFGAKPTQLANGVSMAIITTIFGLAICIPAQIAYSILRRRASRRIDELESACEGLATAFETLAKKNAKS